MDSTSLMHKSWSILSHSSWRRSLSAVFEYIAFAANLLSDIHHSISMGLRSGLFAAQLSTFSFNFIILSLTIFDVCHGAKSCWKVRRVSVRIFFMDYASTHVRVHRSTSFHSCSLSKSSSQWCQILRCRLKLRAYQHHQCWFAPGTQEVAFPCRDAILCIDFSFSKRKT